MKKNINFMIYIYINFLFQLFFNYNILNNSLIFFNRTVFSISSNISRNLFSSIYFIIHEYPRFQEKWKKASLKIKQ